MKLRGYSIKQYVAKKEMLTRPKQDQLEALALLGTDWHKEFLEIAPYLTGFLRIDFGLSQTADGNEKQASLRAGVSRHRHGISPCAFTHERPGHTNAYSESNGISFEHSRSSQERTAFVLIPTRLPAPDATAPLT